jgi:hypothetical protein
MLNDDDKTLESKSCQPMMNANHLLHQSQRGKCHNFNSKVFEQVRRVYIATAKTVVFMGAMDMPTKSFIDRLEMNGK